MSDDPLSKGGRLRTSPKPFVFVLMPFDKEFDDIYRFGIKGAADEVGAYAERLDEQVFLEGMLERIFNQISRADVVVADMTGRNPNVFYEVGYAHALDKVVLLLTKDAKDIPFDLKHRQHTVYSGSIDTLKRELVEKLKWAIAESERQSSSEAVEHFSITLSGHEIPSFAEDREAPAIVGTITEKRFSVPIQLRNDSFESVLGITHVYVFCEEGSAVVPCRMTEQSFSYPATAYPYDVRGLTSGALMGSVSPNFLIQSPKPKAISALTASDVDAYDGLTKQYRIPTSFPALPPGAVETSNIDFLLASEVSEFEVRLRLRLHSSVQYHDYPFSLRLTYQPEQEGGAGSESAKDKESD